MAIHLSAVFGMDSSGSMSNELAPVWVLVAQPLMYSQKSRESVRGMFYLYIFQTLQGKTLFSKKGLSSPLSSCLFSVMKFQRNLKNI